MTPEDDLILDGGLQDLYSVLQLWGMDGKGARAPGV